MPIYEFRSEDGTEYAERYFTAGRSPELYSWMEFDGRRWQRIPSIPRGVQVKNNEFMSLQERRWDPDAPDHVPHGQKFAGAPVFRNKQQREDFIAKKADKYNRKLVWGEGDPDSL